MEKVSVRKKLEHPVHTAMGEREGRGGECRAIHNTDVDTNDRVLPTGILRYIG